MMPYSAVIGGRCHHPGGHSVNYSTTTATAFCRVVPFPLPFLFIKNSVIIYLADTSVPSYISDTNNNKHYSAAAFEKCEPTVGTLQFRW